MYIKWLTEYRQKRLAATVSENVTRVTSHHLYYSMYYKVRLQHKSNS